MAFMNIFVSVFIAIFIKTPRTIAKPTHKNLPNVIDISSGSYKADSDKF